MGKGMQVSTVYHLPGGSHGSDVGLECLQGGRHPAVVYHLRWTDMEGLFKFGPNTISLQPLYELSSNVRAGGVAVYTSE